MKKQGKSRGEGQKTKQKEKNPAISALGRRIKELRKEKGYSSLYDFAYEHEISRGQYARFEQGANMTFLNFLKVASALGITLSELFEGLDENLHPGKASSERKPARK